MFHYLKILILYGLLLVTTKSKVKLCLQMGRKFQGAMQIVAMAETVVWICQPHLLCFWHIHKFMSDMIARDFRFQIYINIDDSSENYWLRLLVREWAQFCIFLYIGYVWITQSQVFRWKYLVFGYKCTRYFFLSKVFL